MKYTLTGYVDRWDTEGIEIGEYNTLWDAQEAAREYMQGNAYHGFVELEILPIGSYNYWNVKYIYDVYTGWEQY